MTLKEILQEKEDRLQSVPDALANKAIEAQRQILRQLIDDLDSLEREDGKIRVSTKNLARIQTIVENLSRFIFDGTEYGNALKAFAKEFKVQAGLTQEFIKELEGAFADKELYQENLQLSQRQAVDLLARSGIRQAFINPMKELLQASVTSGSSFAEAVAALTEFIMGSKEKEGALLSHVKQVAYDGFAFADRQYIKVVTGDLGYEFFQYFGGTIEDSRCFCSQRSNEIFHRLEIEYWGETPSLWDKKPGCSHGGGRIAETTAATIWTYLGGYNCRHQLAPVAPTRVPKDVLSRARKSGYIK